MLSLLLIAGLFSPSPAQAAPEKPAVEKPAVDGHRGEPFTLTGPPISVDELTKDPQKFVGQTVKVQGKVSSVCKTNGCWVAIEGSKPLNRARISFPSPTAFAPQEAVGSLAVVEGKVELKDLNEKQRQHLADDAKAPLETVPAQELRVVAHGLSLTAQP